MNESKVHSRCVLEWHICRLVCPSSVFFLRTFRLIRYASSSIAETFPLDEQEAEENLDLALIASLESDVLPDLDGPRIPDDLVSQLGKFWNEAAQFMILRKRIHPRSSGLPYPSSISPSSSSSSTWTSISTGAARVNSYTNLETILNFLRRDVIIYGSAITSQEKFQWKVHIYVHSIILNR
jgi:hypothetical protein